MSDELFHVSSLSMALFGYSVMVDEGSAAGITIADVREHVAEGDLFDFLKKRAGGVFASGFLEGERPFNGWYLAQLKGLCDSMAGRERRKYGIATNGIALLISYTAEIIQQGDGFRLK